MDTVHSMQDMHDRQDRHSAPSLGGMDGLHSAPSLGGIGGIGGIGGMHSAPARDHYYVCGVADPGTAAGGTFFFSPAELRAIVDARELCGVRVWLEHGDATKEVLGTVVYAWVEEAGRLHVIMAFAKDSARSRLLYELIGNGLYRGISLGYTAALDGNMDVTRKVVNEVSIVRVPYHDTCWVYTVTDELPPALRAAVGAAAAGGSFCGGPGAGAGPRLLEPAPAWRGAACAAAADAGGSIALKERARAAAQGARASLRTAFAALGRLR